MQAVENYRNKAMQSFESLPLEKSQYTKLNLNFSKILGMAPSKKASLPQHAKNLLLDKSKIFVVQLDDEIVRINIPEDVSSKGFVISDLRSASQHKLVDDFFSRRAVKPDESKLIAFNCANFRSGIFIHVPENVEILEPVHYIFVSSAGSANLSQLLVDAGVNSRLVIAEQDYSEDGEKSFHSSLVEFHLAEHSAASYILMQNFASNVESFVTKRALVGRNAKMNWVVGRLGSALTKSLRDTMLVGEGSEVEDIEVFFASGKQHFDTTANIRHAVPNTKGSVLVKGVLRDSARSVSQGMIKVDKNAQKTDSFLAEHTLMLDKEARSDAIPGLEIEANDVRATHSASTGHIDHEQVFYLSSRGLEESEAKKLIVLGFLESALEKMPLDISEDFKALLNEKWDLAMR